MKILAIDPGTRTMGVALLDREQLVYYGVRAIRMPGAPCERLKEARRTVLRLINDLRPDTLVVEKTFFANNRNGAVLNALVKQIVAIGRRKRLRVVSYAANTVKKRVCGNGRASKKEIARAVICRYPELGVYFSQDRKWKERYHQNMFDAVAVGMVGMRRDDNATQRKQTISKNDR